MTRKTETLGPRHAIPGWVRWTASGAAWTAALLDLASRLAVVLLVSGRSARRWGDHVRRTVLAERESIEALWMGCLGHAAAAAGAYVDLQIADETARRGRN